LVVGFEVDFVHLDGHIVKIARNTITPHGEVIVIQGEGMPRYETMFGYMKYAVLITDVP